MFGGDFVAGVAREQTKAKALVDFDFFPFPIFDEPRNAVVAGVDIGVALTEHPAAERFLAFLATPEAASVWAQRPGFTSPNRNLPETAYRDDLTRRVAQTVASADIHVDLSDQ